MHFNHSIHQKITVPTALFWFQIAVIGFGCLVFVRLAHTQLLLGRHYQQRAEENRLFVQDVPAERGVLLSRYGEPLVHNQRRYWVAADQQLFAQLHPVTTAEALPLLATQAAQVQFRLARSYIWPSLSSVLGYTSVVSADDLGTDRSGLLVDQVGRMGLEQALERQLLGEPGKIEYEINALGKKQQELKRIAPVPGKLITTSLDPYLSEIASRALGGQTGAVVIVDAATGQVLTLLSSPSFDSNQLQPLPAGTDAEKARQQQVQAYLADDQKVFFNRAISGMYPPGSIFKLVTALGGLEAGAIDAQTEVDDQGVLKVGTYSYANWYFTQYGRVEGKISLVRALARSNDIYFYTAAEKLGPDKLAAAARLYGFGKPTGIELPGEAAGLVPDPAWKEKTLGEPWYLGNTFHYGIGQGDILVTPLQLVELLQTIAHQQQQCRPSLRADQAPQCHDLGVSEAATDLVLQGMIGACSPGGTAFPFFPYNQRRLVGTDVKQNLANGVVACKTGTAEFGAADARGYRQTHAWFGAIVGTAGVSQQARQVKSHDTDEGVSTASISALVNTPVAQLSDAQLHALWQTAVAQHGFPSQLVMVVLVESSTVEAFQEGSRNAAPIAKRVVDWMMSDVALPNATMAATPPSKP